jgi:hypothetical protein
LEQNKQIAQNDISLLLEGTSPRLIDEWQVIRQIWNAVRTDIDERNEPGLYILTGSTTPTDDKSLHTGIGRLSFVEMKPMTLFESGESNVVTTKSKLRIARLSVTVFIVANIIRLPCLVRSRVTSRETLILSSSRCSEWSADALAGTKKCGAPPSSRTACTRNPTAGGEAT